MSFITPYADGHTVLLLFHCFVLRFHSITLTAITFISLLIIIIVVSILYCIIMITPFIAIIWYYAIIITPPYFGHYDIIDIHSQYYYATLHWYHHCHLRSRHLISISLVSLPLFQYYITAIVIMPDWYSLLLASAYVIYQYYADYINSHYHYALLIAFLSLRHYLPAPPILRQLAWCFIRLLLRYHYCHYYYRYAYWLCIITTFHWLAIIAYAIAMPLRHYYDISIFIATVYTTLPPHYIIIVITPLRYYCHYYCITLRFSLLLRPCFICCFIIAIDGLAITYTHCQYILANIIIIITPLFLFSPYACHCHWYYAISLQDITTLIFHCHLRLFSHFLSLLRLLLSLLIIMPLPEDYLRYCHFHYAIIAHYYGYFHFSCLH